MYNIRISFWIYFFLVFVIFIYKLTPPYWCCEQNGNKQCNYRHIISLNWWKVHKKIARLEEQSVWRFQISASHWYLLRKYVCAWWPIYIIFFFFLHCYCIFKSTLPLKFKRHWWYSPYSMAKHLSIQWCSIIFRLIIHFFTTTIEFYFLSAWTKTITKNCTKNKTNIKVVVFNKLIWIEIISICKYSKKNIYTYQ